MRLALDDKGDGPAVVLLHSGVCDRRMWTPQVEALAPMHRVIAPDLRGFGESPMPPGRYSDSADVVETVDDLGVERFVLVGSSFGGRVALEVAVTHPERVASLVLLCPAFRGLEPTPTAKAFGEEEERLIDAGDVRAAVEFNVSTWLGPEASNEALDLVHEMQRRAFEVQMAAEATEPEPEPEVVDVDPGQIQAATLVVSGDLDMDHFQNIARHLAEMIPHANLLTLPWAGHLPSVERPDEFTDILLQRL